VKEELVAFLRHNNDVFAWSHEDMPGIDPSVIVHRLNVDPNYKLIKQRKKDFRHRAKSTCIRRDREIIEGWIYSRGRLPRVAI